MRNAMLIFVGILFFLLQNHFLIAQKPVKTVYNATKMTHYKGRIDDINDVTLSLKCEGRNCEGELTYLRSRDQFKLQGTKKGNQLQLREFNQANKCSGYLSGKIEGNLLELDWKNKEGTIGNTLELKKVARKPDFPTFCGDNKWINAYSANIEGERVELILQRVDNHRILGTAYYKDKKKKHFIEGTLSASNNLHLNFIKENTAEAVGSLRCIFKKDQNLSTTYYDKQQLQNFVVFRLDKSLAMNCLEYADYYTSYDFLFPKSDNAIFNEIMVLLTKDWISDCRKNAQQIRKKTPKVEVRASQRAYSWTDVALLTDEFISGMLTYHTTWAEGEATKTFNYNFKTGNPIELATIFKKDFDYKTFVKKYAAEIIIKNPVYKNNKHFRN